MRDQSNFRGWLRSDLLPLLTPRAHHNLALLHPKVRRLVMRPRWGNLMRPKPFSDWYGADRGTPADRPYLSAFIEANARRVRGAVLEIQRDEWTPVALAAGGGPVSSLEVVDVDASNPSVTLVTDLCGKDPFGDRVFDCQIVLQTIQYLPDPVGALRNLFSALGPGGSLLLSAPAISRVDDMCGPEGDLWHPTPAGLERLIGQALPEALVSVEGHGSLAVAAGFLYGISAEEMPRAYSRPDRRFPVVSCALVTKPSR